MVLLKSSWAKCIVYVVDVPAKPEVDHGALGTSASVRGNLRVPCLTAVAHGSELPAALLLISKIVDASTTSLLPHLPIITSMRVKSHVTHVLQFTLYRQL